MTIKHNAFAQLVLANVRSYLRQPEAIFWTYGFPFIMVVGLGLAFNSNTEVQSFFTVTPGGRGASHRRGARTGRAVRD